MMRISSDQITTITSSNFETTMTLFHARGQWLIYYFSSRCKAAWQTFEDNKDSWTASAEQHEWWTMGLHAEGVSLLIFDHEWVDLSLFMQERLALAIGYHISQGGIVKIPAWVTSFMHSTHVQDTDKAILPPLDLLPNTTYPNDPSQIVSSYQGDWWNTGQTPCLPKPYSIEENRAFDAWFLLDDQVCFTYFHLICIK